MKHPDVSQKTLLIPDMAPNVTRLLAASWRAWGVNAVVMETFKGLVLGKEFTSGKECFPCQITLGDVLHHLGRERERLGSAFSPGGYAYFLPEAEGPCRFGMYGKMQRLVLDRFEEFKEVQVVTLSTNDSYAAGGILPWEKARHFRRLAYVGVVIGDVLDRVAWRVRPYEWREGMTDGFMETGVAAMASLIEAVGADFKFSKLYALLEDIVSTARSFIDPRKPRRPRIGVIGEIYLRSHPRSNQDILRLLERFGGEVVDASVGEWVNFVSYDRARKLRRERELAKVRGDRKAWRKISRRWIAQEAEKGYQAWRRGQVYRTALRRLDIQADHDIGCIERKLDRGGIFSFDVGTEACLSIGGALIHAEEGFNGIVNVFPFTCMPSTICSAVVKPILHRLKVPYLDAPYDEATQPNREAVLRTFLYQAKQHLERQRDGKVAK